MVEQARVVISTHNPTMRTALRLVALTAPFWAIYVPGLFLGIFGFFLDPIFFAANERIHWMLAAFALGASGTAILLLNTLVLTKSRIAFPPLKAAQLPISQIKKVDWFWHAYEHEVYMRFSLEGGEHIDIHALRWTPEKIGILKDALKQWSPRCEVLVNADDLEDLIALKERFYQPKKLSLGQTASANASESIEIPYQPHERYSQFCQSLGANEKYFWYCWLTVLLVPCLMRIPDIIWGFFADYNHIERYIINVPPVLRALDLIRDGVWECAVGGFTRANDIYLQASSQPFGVCILLGIAILSIVALAVFTFQANGITLRRKGMELFFHWHKLVLYRAFYAWQDMIAFQLDQFGDDVNPEKWRMQITMFDHSTVNLKIEAIKGAEARETLLKTIGQMAPHAVIDPALSRALMPPQKQSYTELWLQSLSAPPKRNRLAPLSERQKLKDGRYLVERQLASGGQGVAYVAKDLTVSPAVLATGNEPSPDVVLKEFVLPVYTSRAVRKQALEKFENEARILGALAHPQIVKLLDYFLEDHRAYLVLEHIDGVSLRTLVQESGPLNTEQICALSLQMCTVLEYLHALSPPVVHRDFTPENLILNRDGKLVLIDFNVAQQQEWTTTGTVVGKHAYLPPEQFRGRPNAQSDLYAMGATLFFLCTGRDPEPISCSHPSRTSANVDPEFDQIVAKLTAIELEDRYQTVAATRHALQAVIDRTILKVNGQVSAVEGVALLTQKLAGAVNALKSNGAGQTERPEVIQGAAGETIAPDGDSRMVIQTKKADLVKAPIKAAKQGN